METGQYEQRTNVDIERLFNGPNIEKCIVLQRLKGTDHIWRDNDSLMRLVLVTKLNKTCSRERPRHRWLDRVNTNLNQVKETANIQDADKRNRWKNLVEAAKDLNGL